MARLHLNYFQAPSLFVSKSLNKSLIFARNNTFLVSGLFFWVLFSSIFLGQNFLSFFLGFFVKAGKLVSHQSNLAHIFSALLSNLHPQHQPTYNLVSYSPADLFAVLLVKAPLRTNGEGVLSDLPYLLATFSQNISILYRVSFVGLSRRLSNIVKNKYSFRRQYVCVLPASRLRYGFHLVSFCLKFADGRTRLERLLSLVKSVLFQEDSSPILFMRYQQQKHVLGVLRKQYLLS